MVSHFTTVTNKGCKIAAHFFFLFSFFFCEFRLNKSLIIRSINSRFCKDQEVLQQGSEGYLQNFFSIGATIRIGREMLCFLYAGFFVIILFLLFGDLETLEILEILDILKILKIFNPYIPKSSNP